MRLHMYMAMHCTLYQKSDLCIMHKSPEGGIRAHTEGGGGAGA
jgi:hypothetical protein